MGFGCVSYLPNGTRFFEVEEFLQFLGYERLKKGLFYAGRVMFELDLFTQQIEKFFRCMRHQLEEETDYNRGMEISNYTAISF